MILIYYAADYFSLYFNITRENRKVLNIISYTADSLILMTIFHNGCSRLTVLKNVYYVEFAYCYQDFSYLGLYR